MSLESDLLESIQIEVELYESSHGTGDAHHRLDRISQLLQTWTED